MTNLPPEFPTTLSPLFKYQKGSIIPWYAGDTKAEARQAKKNLPEGWSRLTLHYGRMNYPIVKIKPNSLFNQSDHYKYVIYIVKD